MRYILALLLWATSFLSAFDMDSEQEHDANFRKFYCNTTYRTAITELPEHLKDACHKSGMNPDSIHVFKEKLKENYRAHAVGTNVMISDEFEKLDPSVQQWCFAHELSHVKHGDTKSCGI